MRKEQVKRPTIKCTYWWCSLRGKVLFHSKEFRDTEQLTLLTTYPMAKREYLDMEVPRIMNLYGQCEKGCIWGAFLDELLATITFRFHDVGRPHSFSVLSVSFVQFLQKLSVPAGLSYLPTKRGCKKNDCFFFKRRVHQSSSRDDWRRLLIRPCTCYDS